MFEITIHSAQATIAGDALQVVGTIRVGQGPEAMAITPNGNYLYVANYLSGTVSVINAFQNKVSATIALPSNGPTHVAITPDGATAFVLTSSGVVVISTSTSQVLKTILAGPSFGTGLAVTPSGTQLYVSNFSGTVTIINVATYQIEKTLTVGSNTLAVAISPDGKSAYAAAAAVSVPFYLTKIDVASQTIVAPQLRRRAVHQRTIGDSGLQSGLEHDLRPGSR